MIRVLRSDGGRTIVHLDAGASSAFVDRDWIPISEGRVAAPYVAADGGVWHHERQLAPDVADPTRHVGAWISALVDEIVGLVDGIARDRLQVTGDGVTAQQVRQRLGVSETISSPSPRAIIEMTGKPDELRSATEAVADGGLIVLAGESDPPTEINLYRDVHRRGLHVLGVSRLGETREPGPDEVLGLPEPVAARAGEPLPFGLWYRVVR